MSSSALKLLAASGAKGSATYVDDVFSTTLYTGDNSTQTVTTGIDVLGEGGLIWVKARSFAGGHNLIDSAQGSSYNLDSTSVNAPANNSTQFTFLNNGYRINGGSTAWDLNQNNQDYCAWSWQKQPGFFDVVTFEAPANADDDFRVSHNLGTVPGMIIVKSVDATGDWYVYHRSFSAPRNDSVKLNSNGASAASGDFWGESNPTATDFGVQVRNFATRPVTTGAGTYVAYLFAHDAQEFGTDEDEAIIKCGTYTGNGSSTGPIIDLGFEPQWLLIKNIDDARDWVILDSMRGIVTGGNDERLLPNSNDSESGDTLLDLTSTGFQLTYTGDQVNGNGENYIYVAIRRPFKPAEEFAATTDLFGIVNSIPANSANNGTVISTSNQIDMMMGVPALNGYASYVSSRFQGGKATRTQNPNAEFGSPQFYFDYTKAFKQGIGNDTDFLGYTFTRAPGFFDVVAYTGSATQNTEVKHNLGVVPEMVWRKKRNGSQQWYVWASALAGGQVFNGNFYTSSGGFSSGQYYTGDTQFAYSITATAFTQGALYQTSNTYIAYLFASVDGISKIGTYTGTGNDLNVACGFSAGARLVMIKRTDAAGDWYYWDSARGIIAGNDPYLLLNSDAAQVTNTDYIDPLASGFTVTSSAPVALNASGGTYLFYAIA